MLDRWDHPAQTLRTRPELLDGGGEVRQLMRECDWSKTPMGEPATWSPSLRAIVRVMLTSRFAMWMAWGPELTFLCNDAYLPTVGVKRDWVIGSRSDNVWAEIWRDIGPRIDRVLTTGEATWDEALLLYLERNGFPEESYHTFSYSPLADDAGTTTGILCVIAEVTERVIDERQLATLRDLGARLAEASTRTDVIRALEICLGDQPRDLPFLLAYLFDDEGRANLVAAHGLPADQPQLAKFEARWSEAIAKSVAPLLIDLAPNLTKGLSLDFWQRPPRQALLTTLKRVDGGAPAGFLVAGLNPHRCVDAGYRGFVDLLTAQVSAAVARADEYEREKRRAEALAELDRAKTAFFSNVSHEFRTPLTLMLGPLEDALAEPSGASAQLRGQIDMAHRNALRLLRLVNALLDFSRIEAGRVVVAYRPTDLSSLTAELASSFRSATERAGLRLTVNAQPLSQNVYVDRDMWEKIVLNLVSNAFKYTFRGEITVSLHEEARFAVLSVQDTGVGIAKTELPRLFDRFHRVEGAEGRSFEGSGIGLALVQELVKQHSGDVAVTSEIGRGSNFIVRIPLGVAHLPSDSVQNATDAKSGAMRAQAFVEEALRWLPGETAADTLIDAGAALEGPLAGEAIRPDTTMGRVLLADDNSDLRDYITRLLAERGYDVEAVADGETALAAARASRPDLLVTDVMMPRLNGFELVRALRADPVLRDLPVVMLSARAGEDSKVEGLDAGADDYLTKPFSARELLARVSANISMARLRRDAAAAVQASQMLASEQAERVQLALDAGAIIGTWVWDVRADIVKGDVRFARAFNLDPERCRTGVPISACLSSIFEEDRPRAQALIEEALMNGGAFQCDYRLRQRDGSLRWIEAHGRVSFGPDGTASRFPGVLIDIENSRRIESELRELNEQLEQRIAKAMAEREQAEAALRQATKMEAVGQLTGGIAHDFNNLLTVIVGNIDIARRSVGSGSTERISRAIENAQKGADRAAALTQRLLAFSRGQPLAPKPLNLDRLVADIADLVQRALGETIRLEIVSTPELWLVEADRNQLEAALLNLAVNARDAMPDGGVLTIESANVRLDEPYSAAHVEAAPGHYAVLAITDTGIGMSKVTLARVFDPFFTTKEVGRGTGLGLSMVYGFVKQSGGHIKIYSEIDKGTTVKIYLPKLMNGDVAEEAPPAQNVEQARRAVTVLVVEDDDDVRAYTVDILRELGYRVLEAHDGPAALRLIERRTSDIALLFTDVVMPAMSGNELAKAARGLQPDLKVLFTSGYSRNAIMHGGRLDPGVEMIAKPFTYRELATKIADVVENGPTGTLTGAQDMGLRAE